MWVRPESLGTTTTGTLQETCHTETPTHFGSHYGRDFPRRSRETQRSWTAHGRGSTPDTRHGTPGTDRGETRDDTERPTSQEVTHSLGTTGTDLDSHLPPGRPSGCPSGVTPT